MSGFKSYSYDICCSDSCMLPPLGIVEGSLGQASHIQICIEWGIFWFNVSLSGYRTVVYINRHKPASAFPSLPFMMTRRFTS